MLPRILFIVDVRNWAYDFRAQKWKQLLQKSYDIDILYLEDYNKQNNTKPVFDHKKYDGIVFFYHRAVKSLTFKKTHLPLNKIAVCINNGKWFQDGEIYTYEKYFKYVKLLIGCNKFIVDTFSKYHENVVRVSQAVDETLFYCDRKSSVNKNHIGSKFIVGWNGNVDDQFKNVKSLAQACKDAGVQLNVVKNLNQRQLRKWYNTVDAVACVSFPKYEGGPNMILEAGACKRPLITTPVGICEEIAVHERNAIVVPHFRLDMLGQEIERLSKDIILRKRLSVNLNRDVLDNWTYTARLGEIDNALKKLIS